MAAALIVMLPFLFLVRHSEKEPSRTRETLEETAESVYLAVVLKEPLNHGVIRPFKWFIIFFFFLTITFIVLKSLTIVRFLQCLHGDVSRSGRLHSVCVVIQQG